MLRRFLLCILALGAVALNGCGDDDDTSTPIDNTAPTVSAASLADGATGVTLLQDITITFSEAMDPASLDETTVSAGGAGGGLRLSYDPDTRQLVVRPYSLWTADTAVQLSIDGATDVAGNALAAYSLGFSTAALDCAGLADRFEANDTMATATSIELDSLYPALSLCGEDSDCFAFSVTERTRIITRNSFAHGESENWIMEFARADSQLYTVVGTLANAGASAYTWFTFEPGTYYLVNLSHALAGHILYDLTLETAAPCEDDIHEDNDFRDEAAPLAAGLTEGLRGCFLDADWYSIDVTAGQTITVTVTARAPAEAVTRRVMVLGPGDSAVSETGNTNPLVLPLTMTGTGTALIMTQFWADDVVYDLDIHVTGK